MLHLMFPTHLALGYLLGIYSKLPVAYLVLGSILPDIADRPLYWLGLAPSTHALGHSIAVAVPACALAIAVLGRGGVALAIGWLGHLLADFLNVVTTQGLAQTPYYVLYVAPPENLHQTFPSVTIDFPLIDIGHTLHPLLLVSEVAVLCWTVAILLRGRTVPDRIRRTESS